MLRIFRRRQDQPFYLWYRIARTLQRNLGIMEREDLLQQFEGEFSRDIVAEVIRMMVKSGLLIEEDQLWSDGHGQYHAMALILPSRRQLRRVVA